MNDADRLRIFGPVQPMDHAGAPLVPSLLRDTSSRTPARGPSSHFPAKGRTRITVAAYSLCAAAVIHFLFRSLI